MKLFVTMLCLGIVSLIYGCNLKSFNKGTSKSPQKWALSQIEEDGGIGSNRYIRISKHTRLYEYAVFEQHADDLVVSEGEYPDPGNVYFPIVQDTHPIISRIKAIENEEKTKHIFREGKYNYVKIRQLVNKNKISFPPLSAGSVTVIIKSKSFEQTIKVPFVHKKAPELRGMVLSKALISDEDREMIAANFPNLNMNRIVLLEMARKPNPGSFIWSLIFGGWAFIIIGAWQIVTYAKPKKRGKDVTDEDFLTQLARKRNPHLYDDR